MTQRQDVSSCPEGTVGNGLYSVKSELDKSVVMAWVGFPAQSQMSLFLEYPIPRKTVVVSLKNMAEAVTRDIVSSDWLKLAVLCLFRAQSVSKNKSICDCAGARPQSNRSTLLSNSLWILSYTHHVEYRI